MYFEDHWNYINILSFTFYFVYTSFLTFDLLISSNIQFVTSTVGSIAEIMNQSYLLEKQKDPTYQENIKQIRLCAFIICLVCASLRIMSLMVYTKLADLIEATLSMMVSAVFYILTMFPFLALFIYGGFQVFKNNLESGGELVDEFGLGKRGMSGDPQINPSPRKMNEMFQIGRAHV